MYYNFLIYQKTKKTLSIHRISFFFICRKKLKLNVTLYLLDQSKALLGLYSKSRTCHWNLNIKILRGKIKYKKC